MFGTMKGSKDHSAAFAWVGLIAIVVFLFAWICADAIDAAWVFAVNTISELGVSETDASLYFNYGCRFTGILLVIFGAGRAIYSKNAGHTAEGVLIIIGGAALALVGVYTMDGDDQSHLFVSVAAALFMYLAIIASAAGSWVKGNKMFAGLSIIISLVLFAMFFAYDLAKLEAYGIILVMVWMLANCIDIIVTKRKS
jgi:hypothetical membrane protein